ncbi:hypothetical protein K466DRAFT_519869 [Polyporus arcularius HHB13444]|uniref:F-box domain-containing protein n=1 Tax=Polyporus arcularius HHB13444 TaxID=1314778 RepID=A0A5C3PI27_9APHY|nr:hypothetical protein K466DRAFT_519869 [Polyporus arcularius HHB13444]
MFKFSTSEPKDSLRLPPEVWRLVVEHLSREDARSLLSVCTLFHELAVPSVFSHVTVRFGLWPPHDWSADENDDTQQSKELRRRSELSTCELLFHILRTPSFARVVKKLSVRAYGEEDVFELYALKEAILVMTNIASFCWEGRRPLPTALVLDALAHSSGHVLRELSLPSTVSTWSYAAKLQPLQALTLHRPDDECDALLLSGSAQVPIAAAVEANEETLTRLTLYGDGIWDCPLRSLLRLQELELILPISLNGFEHVMAQCAELRYLTLDLKSGSRHFVRMVQAHPTTLPLLTAFKLLGTNADDAGSIALADFLRDKKNLRMLDFGWLRNEEVVEDGPEGGLPLPLLEVLPQLPALEVLGLTVARNRLTPATIRFLAQYIPPQLSALMLRLESRVFFEVNGAAEEWTDLVAKLTSLRYLHVLNKALLGDVKRKLLENHPRSLELFGYGCDMRWIGRDLSGHGSPKDLPPWPLAKVTFCTAEDFGCAEWEWLFRYHCLDALAL